MVYVVWLVVSELIVEVGQSCGSAATARYPWICGQLVDDEQNNDDDHDDDDDDADKGAHEST